MKEYAIGVDIGGTTVKLGLFDRQGQVLEKWEIPTVKEDQGSHILPDIAAAVKDRMASRLTKDGIKDCGCRRAGSCGHRGHCV